jgi:DNA-directed RNA polymerase subunit RPC12/RpoP
MPAFKLTCKRCGVSRIALRLERCTHCGKYVCVNCLTNQNGVNLCLDCCAVKVNSDTVGAINAATRAEQAGRYEDAARDYERLGFLDKARSMRDKSKTTTVKHQYVDINHLLEQIRQGNLVVPYKCPNCQAGITINKDTSVDRLTNCPYCGSGLVVSDIEKFLSSIL